MTSNTGLHVREIRIKKRLRLKTHMFNNDYNKNYHALMNERMDESL